MARDRAPDPPRDAIQFVDPRSGVLTVAGMDLIRQMWRQIVAGHVVVPCEASGTGNAIILTPVLHEEGAATYADGMVLKFKASAGSTGDVTASLKGLDALKVYKSDGAAQAGNGDVVSGSVYLLVYDSTLDSNAGGLILK